MSVVIDGQHLTCSGLHRIAHGENATLGPDVHQKMESNVATMPPGPSILEEKRHWLVGGFASDLTADELCKTFIIGHCAGVGEPLPKSLVRATMAARANVLATATTGWRGEGDARSAAGAEEEAARLRTHLQRE